MERQHWQEHILRKIPQQIKNISNVPEPQREELLGSLADEALRAAEHCDEQVRSQLMELAEFARNAQAKQRAGLQNFMLSHDPSPRVLRTLSSSCCRQGYQYL